MRRILPQTPRIKTLLVAIVASLLVVGAGTALGAFAIYVNNFDSKREVKDLKKTNGGKACDRDKLGNNRFGATVSRGKRLCAWAVPVISDRPGGDLIVSMNTELRMRSNRQAARRTFAFVGLRQTKEAGYQLRVFPKRHEWVLTRGLGGPGFPLKGRSRAVDGPGKTNALRLAVIGTRVRAWVNGTELVDIEDENAAEVSGQHVWAGVGQGRKLRKPAQFAFDRLRVLVPPPGR